MSARNIHLYAGTAGHSAWFSDDLGESWVHPNSHSGLYLEARVWSYASHPATPSHLYAGTDMGLFRWDEEPARWTHLPSQMQDVWAVQQSPSDPQFLIAGTRPAGLYRSTDGGRSWSALPTPSMAPFSDVNGGPTRVTQILFDPIETTTIWATVEVGGIYRSRDGGEHWDKLEEGLVSTDLHGVAVLPRADGKQAYVYATTNRGLHRSDDGGNTWTFQELDNPWQYTRAIVPRPDNPAIVFLGTGNGPPGNDGRLLRSRDYGLHWEPVRLPGELNSTVWCIAVHPSDPMLVFVATNLGELFRSDDGGERWYRLPHEFGEVRALHWRPLPPGMRKAQHCITRPMIKVPW